jgi:hypothetical protein
MEDGLVDREGLVGRFEKCPIYRVRESALVAIMPDMEHILDRG